MSDKNYWNKEKCQEEAKKYNSRVEFQFGSKSAYSFSRKNGWLDFVCTHMERKQNPKNYWTKERCAGEAIKYSSRKKFATNSNSAYQSAKKNGWLDEICEHIPKKEIKPNGYWTIERCISEAQKYKNRKEFIKNSYSAYQISLRNGWIDIVCKNLPGWMPKGYWTKEKCKEEAAKYKTRVDFELGSSSACQISRRNNWIDEICSHMEILGTKYKRCIYAMEFDDNHVYIGLTYNLNERFRNHIKDEKRNRSSVIKHIKKTGLVPVIKQVTEYIDVKEAKLMEEEKKNEYLENGWNILNKAKCGAIGSNTLFWTLDKCIDEAKNHENLKSFRKNKSGAYGSARRNGWLKIISEIFSNKLSVS